MQKIHGAAFAAALLALCQAAQPQASQSPTGSSPPAFRIDTAQSEVRVLVHHSSRIGYNHVIVNRNVTGHVRFTGDAVTSSFDLAVPVMDFNVDDPDARREEGGDYEKAFSAGDRSDTKGHMLGPKLLDGARFATITVNSTAIAATAQGFTATLAVTVAGHESTLQVPFELDKSAGRMAATGSVQLRQTELGLKPLSFMMGAVTVQDEVTVKFKLVATAS